MAITAAVALQFIAQDEAFLLDLYFQLNQWKGSEREALEEILQRYITQSLEDANGYIKPGAMAAADLDALQDELLGLYATPRLEQSFNQMAGLVDLRLASIDDLMLSLELEGGILGPAVWEMNTVQEQINKIAEGLVRGAHGEGDYKGSIERVEESMLRYRLDTQKPEMVLRSEMIETLQTDAGAGINHANSVAVTAMAVVDRELRRAQAEEAGVEHGLYAGPFDGVIRPFCDQWLGQVMSWDFWDSLRNDMPEGLFDYPVSINGGGINCRHRIIAWLLEWENGERDLRHKFAAAFAKELKLASPGVRAFYNQG